MRSHVFAPITAHGHTSNVQLGGLGASRMPDRSVRDAQPADAFDEAHAATRVSGYETVRERRVFCHDGTQSHVPGGHRIASLDFEPTNERRARALENIER